MKTSIKINFVKAFIAILLATAIFPLSTFASNEKPKNLYTISDIRKISVKGNVEIILVQRSLEGISYTDDNVGFAKITQEGNLLRITGKSKETSKLFVYVNDIYRIEAGDNVTVKTEDRLTTKFLQIFLKGNAHADINTTTLGLYTVIEDNSSLKLSGSTGNHTLAIGKTQKLNTYNFVAFNTVPAETLAINNEIVAIK